MPKRLRYHWCYMRNDSSGKSPESLSERSLTQTERERLQPVLEKTTIPVCVSIEPLTMISEKVTLRGQAVGGFLTDRQILLHEDVFDRLDDAGVQALLAHEIGHHRGYHNHITDIGTVILALPLVSGGIGAVLWGKTWPILVGLAGLFVFLLVAMAVSRRLELDADRRAAEVLGDAESLEALCDSDHCEKSLGIKERWDQLWSPWPSETRRLAVIRGLQQDKDE
jgi:Zn-dependent protease with chaperone function